MTTTSPDTIPLDDIVTLDATALSAAIKTKAVSCREVMSAHLARIEAVNGQVNAIVSLRDPAVLLAEADAADEDLARGHWRGPLHGFPHTVKDLAATKGLRTTLGSPLFKDNVPDTDALFVERLRAAGAILIGKTNVPEFGLGSHTYNPVFGTTRNAYDQRFSAGGSSGGAGAALALHMVPLADGSDFGGSLRNPAGWNGVFGLRPSQGRVPALPGPEGYLQQLGTDGPMARTVADLSLLLSVMSGYDSRAPLSIAQPPLPAALLEGDVAGQRIGWLGNFGGAVPVEDGILELGLSALGSLQQAGCVAEEASLDMAWDRIWACWLVWRHSLMAGRYRTTYENPEKRGLLKPEMIFEIEGGLGLTATALYDASETRTLLYQRFLALFERYDALALPSAQVFPFAQELDWPHAIAGTPMDTYHRWIEIMVPGSLSGCPVICVPAGFGGANNLPSGLQLIGRPGGDRELLKLAAAFEAVSRPKQRLPR
ncbi:amidase [Beijerinckia sp. L45]|uniref:amidase n=1 Tax=Beijerinckia sp. L45 TaxID=1641855 RepID=UPI00131DDA95|nr:amidase [Beijerinckia sp. L45]